MTVRIEHQSIGAAAAVDDARSFPGVLKRRQQILFRPVIRKSPLSSTAMNSRGPPAERLDVSCIRPDMVFISLGSRRGSDRDHGGRGVLLIQDSTFRVSAEHALTLSIYRTARNLRCLNARPWDHVG
jgi:hypothetical protein